MLIHSEDGELADGFSICNDANVPVDIWLKLEKDDNDNETGKWQLSYNLYMPRKDRLTDDMTITGDKAELIALIKDQIIPLYQAAMNQLQNIVNGSADNLYYWQESKEEGK